MAGGTKGPVEPLKTMLDGGVGPMVYPIMYHPAFDGIRSEYAYPELLEQNGPDQ